MNLNKSLRIAFRALLLIPILIWVWNLYSGQVGADPAKELNHQTGEVALYFLLLNLFAGILISYKVKMPHPLIMLYQERRWLGVTSFCFLVFHVLLYLLLEGFELKAWEQIYTKTYLIFGSLAWIGMLILAVTSNDFSVRKLGFKKWKFIHKFVYFVSALITVHVLLIEKTDLIKYGLIFAALWILQISRWLHLWKQKKKQTKFI